MIIPAVRNKTFANGNSSWSPFSLRRTMASSPFGDQSAHCTFSSSGLGVPPDNGSFANVPIEVEASYEKVRSVALRELEMRAREGPAEQRESLSYPESPL